MTQSSLDVFENFFGESLSGEHLDALEETPDDQIGDLLVRLNDGWNEWFEARFDKGLPPDQHYYLGEDANEVEPLPLEKYKQLALYFPRFAAADPVESLLASHIQTAQAIGSVILRDVRSDMLTGLRRLVQVAPLARAGALSLVPAVQVRLSEGVQDVARREIESDTKEDAGGYGTTEAFGLATGICSMASYWPMASTQELWNRLVAGGRILSEQLGHCNLSVAHAVAEFDVPSVRRVEIDDLLRLRADEVAFAEFREEFGIAVREALDQCQIHGKTFGEQVFRDRLMPHADRCNDAARGTGFFDGLLLPAGAALAVGGLSWLFSTGDNPIANLENAEKALIATVGPGAAWLGMGYVQRRILARHPGPAIYSALIDRPDRRT